MGIAHGLIVRSIRMLVLDLHLVYTCNLLNSSDLLPAISRADYLKSRREAERERVCCSLTMFTQNYEEGSICSHPLLQIHCNTNFCSTNKPTDDNNSVYLYMHSLAPRLYPCARTQTNQKCNEYERTDKAWEQG